ncbi:dTDP-4-dehydrorhamnose reductase [Cellulophaga sp. E16_2]|uniref:dTDP-4-dehydrorhamnose reductase n=1 Tax=unclassified Cellulophaga TaxID=2634405 RepID=UPI0013FD44A0|nr:MULTISPECIES: dTDP-4-dehydrorhamnose reductase [unclassified Cellulophaga]MBO0591363.1 dTDP-4-dehydrorhamnose reductase [Cellulophaga sp. E16_2]
MKKNIQILVIGANGQLGKCVKDISLKYPSYNFNFKNSKELNITQEQEIQTLFAELNFDYCINCAAYTAVDKAEDDKENAFLVNAEGVKYLAEACENSNTALIHISTDFVFDGTKENPLLENDTPNPINVYGASKLKGEEYIKDILKKYFIIRTSWVYSKYGNNFVKTMLRLGNERDEINVVNDQFGSPTYAIDLAEFIFKIINCESENYGLYHYSNEGSISWYDFAEEIFRQKKIAIKLHSINSEDYVTPAKRPFFSVMDKSKAKKQLNITVPNWKTSLQECLKTFDTH